MSHVWLFDYIVSIYQNTCVYHAYMYCSLCDTCKIIVLSHSTEKKALVTKSIILLVKPNIHLGLSSQAEIEKVLALGVEPTRIVYANPCKQTSFIKYAAKRNVSLMTFDNEDELHKIKAYYPDAQWVLLLLWPQPCLWSRKSANSQHRDGISKNLYAYMLKCSRY